MYATRPPPHIPPPMVRPPPGVMFGGQSPYGGGYGGGGGLYGQQPRNRYFAGTSVVVISFIQLIFGILLLIAQIGLYYYCAWQAVCLVLPTFVAVILFIIASVIGIAAGVERTNGLILTLLVMSVIVVIVTPVNMGLWALPATEGGISRYVPFSLTATTGVTDTLAAIYWGLLFIPIVHWILFIVDIALCAMAICCPGRPCFGMFGGGFYGGGPAVGPIGPGPGYNPSPVYGGYGGTPRAYPY